MALHRWVALLTISLFLGALSWCPAEEPKANGDKDDKQKVDSKAGKKPAATAVNFRKELNLPYNSLSTLGSRIDAARRTPDPVALAHAASELSVAEKVSSKASMTSTEVLKEAAELAKLRKEVAELQAVAQVTQQVANEEVQVKDLKDQITLSQQIADDEKAAIQRNEEPTNKPRKVLINNYTTQTAAIYVNGYLKMMVQPGQSKYCVVEHKWNPTTLTATGDEDITHWGPRIIWGTFDTYTWNLH